VQGSDEWHAHSGMLLSCSPACRVMYSDVLTYMVMQSAVVNMTVQPGSWIRPAVRQPEQ
jgi:hypothetical protein